MVAPRDAWRAGIWAIKSQASQVPSRGPCQEPLIALLLRRFNSVGSRVQVSTQGVHVECAKAKGEGMRDQMTRECHLPLPPLLDCCPRCGGAPASLLRVNAPVTRSCSSSRRLSCRHPCCQATRWHRSGQPQGEGGALPEDSGKTRV